jgi:hypothetical protein
MLVTKLTSQFDITPNFVVTLPYVTQSPVTADSLRHEFMADWKFELVKQYAEVQVHELIGPLLELVQENLCWNANASRKIPSVFVTLEVSHLLKG